MKNKILSHKKDIAACSIIYILVTLLIFYLTQDGYIFGSKIDWGSQHSVLPDYFRQTFYKTGKLVPDFALALGGGQNAYNFSYYGLLNPVYLPSYLLPFVPMHIYVIAISIVLIYCSITLFYIWLKQNCFNVYLSFTGAFLFAFSYPLVFQFHRQIMFVDYFPFLILAFMGIDRLKKKGKYGLLTISVFLMWLTSYFFAVTGVIVLFMYAFYKRDIILKYIMCLITGSLMSGILLIPSFFSLLEGRNAHFSSFVPQETFTLKELLTPAVPLFDFMYSAYGIGLTCISVIALIYMTFWAKNKRVSMISIALIVIATIPIFKYLLNGTLYTRTKALIPFLPIVILIVLLFAKQIVKEKINKVFFIKMLFIVFTIGALVLYNFSEADEINQFFIDLSICFIFILIGVWRNNLQIMLIPPCAVLLFLCYDINKTESFLSDNFINTIYNTKQTKLVSDIIETDNASVFRSNNNIGIRSTNNLLLCDNFYTTGIYSSSSNQNYRRLCNYELNIANPTVNDVSINTQKDILFQTLMGVKYIVSNTDAPALYKSVNTLGDYKIYVNRTAYPLAFANENTISKNEYDTLSPADKTLALLKHIVVDKNGTTSYHSDLESVRLPIDFNKQFEETDNGYYKVDLSENLDLNIPIDDDLKDYVYIITMHIKQKESKRIIVKINDVENILSTTNNAYPNSNFDFKFVISSDSSNKNLHIEIPKSSFEYKDFMVYKIPVSLITDYRKRITPMEDIEYNGNDTITGKINIENYNTYFTTTIPYDKYFTIYDNGKEIESICTNSSFLGAKLSKGTHNIKIVYNYCPYILLGYLSSGIGTIILILLMLYSRKNTTKKVEE